MNDTGFCRDCPDKNHCANGDCDRLGHPASRHTISDRSRGAPPFASLPLRTASSGGDRGRGEDLGAVSLAWEAASGFDSIATIERVYDRMPAGAYVCIHPGCSFARRDPARLWRHVHTAHGRDDLPSVVGMTHRSSPDTDRACEGSGWGVS